MNTTKIKSIARPIYLVSSKDIDNIYKLDLLKINFLEYNINLQNYDALIFTSKNGVSSMQNDSWKDIPSYAISNITAGAIKHYNGNLQYIGKSGHGDDFANELITQLQNKKVLYIRAKKVVSNLVKILNQNHIICDELITYETICNNNPNIKSLKNNAIIIFTSPSTIKCFMNTYSWRDDYYAIAIGNTTAKYFHNGMKFKISEKRSIKSCIDMALSL